MLPTRASTMRRFSSCEIGLSNLFLKLASRASAEFSCSRRSVHDSARACVSISDLKLAASTSISSICLSSVSAPISDRSGITQDGSAGGACESIAGSDGTSQRRRELMGKNSGLSVAIWTLPRVAETSSEKRSLSQLKPGRSCAAGSHLWAAQSGRFSLLSTLEATYRGVIGPVVR